MSSIGVSAAGKSVRVICGPTAAGKSALAFRLAQEVPIAIISADSRLVYRGFDIGTAKPLPSERARVPHFGIDVVDPAERYSAAQWAAGAAVWMSQVADMGREPLIVGGTGFYLRALFAPLFDEPPVDAGRRDAMRAFLASVDTERLRRWCLTLDAARAHLGRTQLLRAVEMVLLTGRRLSELHAQRARAPLLAARYLVVDSGRALGDAIVRRVDAMLDAGWLEETRALVANVPAGAPAWTATGYDALRRVIVGEWSLSEARDATVVATRQYAKRQRTWFRHQLIDQIVVRLDPHAPDAFERLMAWWMGED